MQSCKAETLSWSEGFVCQSGRMKRSEGVGFNCFWFLNSGKANAPLLLFFHGTGYDALYPNRSLFLGLLHAGVDILTVDMDGHGAGSTSYLNPDTIFSWAADAIALARSFRKTSLHLAGYSFGGSLVLHYLGSSSIAHEIDSAILISAPLRLCLHPFILFSELLALSRSSLYRQRRWYQLYGLVPSIGPFGRKGFPIRTASSHSTVWTYPFLIRDLVRWVAVETDFSVIHCPFLLCYGGLDLLVPCSQGRALAAALPLSAFRLFRWETHFSTLLSESLEKEVISWLLHPPTLMAEPG